MSRGRFLDGAAATLLLLTAWPAKAQVVVVEGPDQTVSLTTSWKSRFGDDTDWARPDLDDSGWDAVQIPMGWGRESGRFHAHAWYRLTVQVGPPGQGPSSADRARLRLGVLLGQVDSAYEVYVGGAQMGGVGALPPVGRIDYDRHGIYAIPSDRIDPSGRLVIALRTWKTAATSPRAPAPVEGPFRLGPIEALTRQSLLSELPELVMAIVFVVAGLYHLQLFRRRTELREYLWLGLLAVGFGIYTVHRTQWKYATGLPFEVLKEVEHFLVYAFAAGLVQFLWPFLGQPISWPLRAYQLVNLAAGAFVLVTPGLALNLRLLPWWEYGAIALGALSAWQVARAAWRGHPDGRTIAFGLVTLIACIISDIAVDRGWTLKPRLIPFGFGAFLLSMAVSLANRFSRVHRDVDSLRRDLERRVAERTEELAEAMRAKGRFLANVSHEIRTPMNGVIGMARLLEDTPLTVEQRGYVDTITGSGRALLRLIDDILDFSKIESDRLELETIDFEPRQLVGEVERVFASQAQSKGVGLLATVDEAVAPVLRGDPLRLRQALVNLVGNAVKFTEAGEVALRVGLESQTELAQVLRFEVQDSGIGIAPEALSRLFKPFVQADQTTTRRFGGTGLGLVISRRLVELMGGQIGVSSETGRGSLFWFTARLSRGTAAVHPAVEAPVAAARAASDLPYASRPAVLVAEDNLVNQTVAARMLEKLGYAVDVVSDGDEVLKAIRRRTYAAVLMDGQMPIVDGYAATRAIRALEGGARHTPIVALTASAMRGDRERCLASGMDDYVAKPVSPEQLASVLQRWAPLTVPVEDALTVEETAPEAPGRDHVQRAHASVDWDILKDLFSVTQAEFMSELVSLFLRDTRAGLVDLQGARLHGDLSSWRRLSHKVRGSCATLGARAMMEITTQMESLDDEGLASQGDVLLDSLREEFARVEGSLRAEGRRAGAPYRIAG